MSQPRRPILLVAPLFLGAGCTAMPKLHFNEPRSTPADDHRHLDGGGHRIGRQACPTVDFDLSALTSTDADGDPLDYEWTMAPTSYVYDTTRA